MRAVGLNFRDVLNVMGSLVRSDVSCASSASVQPAHCLQFYLNTVIRLLFTVVGVVGVRVLVTTSYQYYCYTLTAVSQLAFLAESLREAFILEILALLVRTVQVQASAASADLRWVERRSKQGKEVCYTPKPLTSEAETLYPILYP